MDRAHTPRRRATAVEILPVVLALVLGACGGTDAAETTTTTSATTTTIAGTTTSVTPPTTNMPATTSAGATVDLPTEWKGGYYRVGTEIAPGFWEADECGCPWSVVDESGIEILGTGDDAVVPADAYAIRLGSCNWAFTG